MVFNEIKIDPKLLCTRQEVLDTLREGESAYSDLAEIRERYECEFGNDLVWRYPISVGDALGAVIVPVKEGFLSIAIKAVDPEIYEIFDPEEEFLLSASEIEQMKQDWESYSRELVRAMQSMWQILYERETNN